jgi:hypothetical protein
LFISNEALLSGVTDPVLLVPVEISESENTRSRALIVNDSRLEGQVTFSE